MSRLMYFNPTLGLLELTNLITDIKTNYKFQSHFGAIGTRRWARCRRWRWRISIPLWGYWNNYLTKSPESGRIISIPLWGYWNNELKFQPLFSKEISIPLWGYWNIEYKGLTFFFENNEFQSHFGAIGTQLIQF